MSVTNSSEFKKARMQDVSGTQLSQSGFNAVIGFMVLMGLALNFAVYFLTGKGAFFAKLLIEQKISPWLLIIPVFILGLVGVGVSQRAKTAGARVLGFLLMSLVMSVSLTIIMSVYTDASILSALSITAVVTVFMMMLSVIFPRFFLSIGRVLGITLLLCIVTEIGAYFIFRTDIGSWMNWMVAIVFCGFIGFDWARAQVYPKTVNNAIACAADIYLDVINLFIRILEITGKRRD